MPPADYEDRKDLEDCNLFQFGGKISLRPLSLPFTALCRLCVCLLGSLGCALKSNSAWCSQDKQLRDVGDWRKNIEDKSDRKKMFDS